MQRAKRQLPEKVRGGLPWKEAPRTRSRLAEHAGFDVFRTLAISGKKVVGSGGKENKIHDV